MRYTSLGFVKTHADLKEGILLPRYYDPELAATANELSVKHSVVSLGELADSGMLDVRAGHEVGKMAYGTGEVPFIRTSDISGWELKADPKHSVSAEVHESYATRQDIREGDILLVRDGTYLIGSATVVRKTDLPMVLQSHVLRLRFSSSSGMAPAAWLVALGSPFVKAQMRSIQFTADIIDTIGDRWREIVVPIPPDKDLAEITNTAVAALASRDRSLAVISRLSNDWCGGVDGTLVARYNPYSRVDSRLRAGFVHRAYELRRSILIPRFYDPDVDSVTAQLAKTHTMRTIGALEEEGALEVTSGIEVGKMAYGTGNIPFVRTADLSNQEVKPDPKQGVSHEIWRQYEQDVQPYDILLVRDGTYLVGSTAVIASDQTQMLFCGGLYKLRATDPSIISAEELLVALNSNYVRAQIRARQFTRDIIDTIGRRLFEIQVPLLNDQRMRKKVRTAAKNAVDERAQARFTFSELCRSYPLRP